MSCPKATHGKNRARINRLLARPWTHTARASRVLRAHLNHHGYVTPHFSWEDMADTQTHRFPGAPATRANAIRHCWNLERLRHALGDIPISIDGPSRTVAHNRAIGGASDSRHTHGDASDHFVDQVNRWVAASPKLKTRLDAVALCEKVFAKGGVGNETSGTLHLDSRGWKARFVTWTAAR